MRLVTEKRIKELQQNFPDAAVALGIWLDNTVRAQWTNFANLKQTFPQADLVKGSDRVVFDVKGNHYRLITVVDYARHGVLVRWFGSRAEYDRLTLMEMQTI